MTPPSVVVIGGGAIGLATAAGLVELGCTDVTVLEQGTLAGGSSGLSVGIIETQYVEPLDIELRVQAMRVFDRLERDHGLRIVRNGYLRLAHDDSALGGFGRSVELQLDLGVADARVVDRAELATLVPDLRCSDLAGALYGPSDGYIDGHEYCAILADLARAGGAVIRQGEGLRAAEAAPRDGFSLRTSLGGELRCDVVVNAAGAWAHGVGALLGAPFPLAPQRHEAVVVHAGRDLGYVMPSVMDYTPRSGGFGLYARHEGPAQLVAGLHTEEPLHGVADPDSYRRTADETFLELVAERLADRLPGLTGARLAHGWAGLYPVTPDGLPQVGPSPARPGVIHAGGAGGAGLQLSPTLGRLAAEWVLHGEPRSLPAAAALAPDRPALREVVHA